MHLYKSYGTNKNSIENTSIKGAKYDIADDLIYSNKNKTFDFENDDDNENNENNETCEYENIDKKDSCLCLKAKNKNCSIDLTKSTNIKDIIESFITRFEKEKKMCYKSYLFYYICYHTLFIPIGIISLITAIISFLITSRLYSNDINYSLTVIIGCLSIVTTFGHSFINYLKLNTKKEMFKEAINDYCCLIDRLQFTEFFVGYNEYELIKSIEKKMLKIKSRLKYGHPFSVQ